MKHIRCSVWGEIKVTPLALSIIDTFEIQRLHYIKTTGLSYKVFPCATSSRFEHSIGVYHVTKTVIEKIHEDLTEEEKLSPRQKDLIAIIGLLHDVGHGPLSHLFDHFLHSQKDCLLPKNHEDRSCAIFRKMVNTYKLDFSEEDVDWITERIVSPPNETWYDTLVCNPYSSFDTDKIDYLIRDCKHFGISLNFNWNRILQNMKVIKNKLCFCEKIYDEIESLFLLRERMHRTIYRHSTVTKYQTFLLDYMKKNSCTFQMESLDEFLLWNDVSIFLHLPFELWKQIECRSWATFHESHAMENYTDRQREKAMQNTLWYKRSNPSVFFFIEK